MRKRMIILAFLALLVTGCGKTDESPLVTVADLPVPDSEKPVMTAMIEPEVAPEAKSLSAAEICRLYLAESEAIDDYCQVLDGGWIRIDDEFYYPEATYPKRVWSAEEVLASYLEQTAPWVAGAEGVELWSQDYAHKFVVTDEWFLVDGVRVTPMIQETHDIAPAKMIKAYQAGQWNGEKWYAHDYSTYVTIDYDHGTLKYHYDAIRYDHVSDPQGLAYDDYAEPPSFLHFEADELAHDGQIVSTQNVPLFIDLPSNKGGFVQARYCGADGTYLVTDGGVEQYKRGRLAKKWRIKFTNESMIARDTIVAGHDGVAFVHIDHKLYKLLPNGTVEKVFDNVTEAKYVENDGADEFYVTLVEGNGLYCCELFSETITEIDTDVMVAAQGSPVFYVKNTNEVYVLDPDQFPYSSESSCYLGKAEITAYMRSYLALDGDFQEFIDNYYAPERLDQDG